MNDARVLRYSAQPVRDGSEHLVLLLHGYGSHELDLLGLQGLLPEGLVLAGLRAPQPMGPGFSWFPISSDLGFSSQSVISAAEYVERCLAEEIVPDDFKTVTLLGFSQGMALATALLQRGAVDYSALVGLSGFWVPVDGVSDAGEADDDAGSASAAPSAEPGAGRETPVFYGRGLADPVIPAARVASTLAVLEGRPGTVIRSYEGMGHSVSPQEMTDVSAFLRESLGLPARD